MRWDAHGKQKENLRTVCHLHWFFSLPTRLTLSCSMELKTSARERQNEKEKLSITVDTFGFNAVDTKLYASLHLTQCCLFSLNFRFLNFIWIWAYEYEILRTAGTFWVASWSLSAYSYFFGNNNTSCNLLWWDWIYFQSTWGESSSRGECELISPLRTICVLVNLLQHEYYTRVYYIIYYTRQLNYTSHSIWMQTTHAILNDFTTLAPTREEREKKTCLILLAWYISENSGIH